MQKFDLGFQNNEELYNIILNQIQNSPNHRITFAEYMDLALYHPQQGYYATNQVNIGKEGDFFTSPSLGSDFGELFAKQLVEIWHILDQPEPFYLVEMGAGKGFLAVDILQSIQQHDPDCFQALEYWIVEKSPELINIQHIALKDWLELPNKVKWKTWNEIPENSVIGCFFSNELVDSFPVHQICWKNRKLQEVYVTVQDGNFVEVADNLSNPKLKDYLDLIGVNFQSSAYTEGYKTEINLLALDWIKTIASKLKQGYLITIDYGYYGSRYYHPLRVQGTLQCYYQHQRHNNPYQNIGRQDITTHVDFTGLESQGELWGLETVGFTQQGLFLMALGLGDRMAALSSSNLGIQQLLHRRDALRQLIDPMGLGGFGVLVQCQGLTEAQKQHPLMGLTVPPAEFPNA